jgi:hypothetical protein
MNATPEPQYIIPARFRRMENMHIVFWLLKDIAWCMAWRPLGVAMTIPTLTIALIIAYRTRHIKAELAHNAAIAVWITANAYWMISEFFHFDEVPLYGMFTLRHLSLIPFVTGALILLYYYVLVRPKEIMAERQKPAKDVAELQPLVTPAPAPSQAV